MTETKKVIMVTAIFIRLSTVMCAAFVTFTCTKIGREERSKSNNFELCPPDVGCDLSKVIVLCSRQNGRQE